MSLMTILCFHGDCKVLFLINLTYLCITKLVQPYGFDVGQSERGTVLKGLDLGVQGMRVGGQVRDLPSSVSL